MKKQENTNRIGKLGFLLRETSHLLNQGLRD
jgi:hypothetical protein